MSNDKRKPDLPGLPRLLTMRSVAEITTYTPQHIYRLVRQGRFPRPRRVGQNRIAFDANEIFAWVDSRPIIGLPGNDNEPGGSDGKAA